MERPASWLAIALIALVGCRAENELQRAMRDMPCRPVAGRIAGASYAAPNTKPSDAARKISLRVYTSKEPDDVRARVALWSGNVRMAKELLEHVTSRGNAKATAWSDYSVALYADASSDNAFQFASALAAADHALDLDPTLPEALFNRALALDAMSLRTAAADAYKKYLQVDTSSSWGFEAQARVEKLESFARNAEKARNALKRATESDDELLINDTAIAFPQESRQWAEQQFGAWGRRTLAKDASGAAAILERCRIIGRALETQLEDSFVADTVRAIDRAADPTNLARAHVAYAGQSFGKAERLFEANGSPMAFAARLWIVLEGTLATDSGSILPDLARQTPQRYPVLRAQMQWWAALFASRIGKQDVALNLYRSASAAFNTLGQKRRVALTLEMESSLMAAAGRTDEAWRLRGAALVSAAEAGDDAVLEAALYGAARDAIATGHWGIAHGLLNVIITTSNKANTLCYDALAWRAFTAQRAGMNRTAGADLRAAHATERGWDELALAEALMAKTPAEALAKLSESLRTAERRGNIIAAAQLLVERARVLHIAGHAISAHDDLERAVGLLGQNSFRVLNTTIRDAVLGTPDRAYRLFADSLDSRGQTEQALNALERSPRPKVEGSLPPRTLLITYGVFDDRLAIYTRSSLGLARTQVAVKPSRIESLVSQFDQAIKDGDQRSFQSTARTLEQILVEPIATQVAAADKLIFVRDPAFGNLPFAALSSGGRHFLLEDHLIVVTPSFSAYLRASQTKTTTSRALLSVGNPLGGTFSPLTAAESEAEEIAAMYPSKSLLVEGDATKKRVLGALPLCDAAHFAVHANAGLGELMPPHLILTKTANDEGILTAPEIAALHLNGLRTVMLAGCRTALSSQPGDDSLVDAFLTAGAGSVVGTLWEVEDASTRTMSTLFHRELRNGATPAQALQKMQLEMIHRNAAPSVWASFQLYGSGQ